MSRILTGIQNTNVPHIGNILGVIVPAIYIFNNSKDLSFMFIANLHSLTKIKNSNFLKESTYKIVSVCLACGLRMDKTIFYLQSDISEITELTWYLNCFSSYKRLTLAHSFKEKKNNINNKSLNIGLFTYPILMGADILLYDAKIIPIGKDQFQHIEIIRNIARIFNRKMGEIFLLPEGKIKKNTMSIKGLDGKKMSKSKKNFINIFSSEKILKKKIMSIRTDSKSIKEKKNPEKDYIFYLYSLLANKEQIEKMRKKYLLGGYRYYDAKISLYECICERFLNERKKFNFFIKKKKLLDHILKEGSKKASLLAKYKIEKVRKILGF